MGLTQIRVFAGAEAALAGGQVFEPLGQTLVEPGGDPAPRRDRVERRVEVFVVEGANEPAVDLDIASHVDHSVIEAGRPEAELGAVLPVEDAGVVDHHVDGSSRADIQGLVDLPEGILQRFEHIPLEATGAFGARDPIDVHVLEQSEVG
jgi:hypothetical protein